MFYARCIGACVDDPVDLVVLRMKFVEGQFASNDHEDHDARCDAHAQSKDVDHGVIYVSYEMPKRNDQDVSKHSGEFRPWA